MLQVVRSIKFQKEKSRRSIHRKYKKRNLIKKSQKKSKNFVIPETLFDKVVEPDHIDLPHRSVKIVSEVSYKIKCKMYVPIRQVQNLDMINNEIINGIL